MFDLSKFSLKGKTAIVTGGGRGIGKAIAVGFAKAGAKVAITSRKIDDLEATAAEIKSFGGVAFPIQSHLGKMDEIKKMVDTALDKLGGRIDILVNNAGASPNMLSVLDSDERLWETIMNLNLKGLYFTSQAVANIMKKQGGGSIINIASIDGFKPEFGVSVYSISKAGVRMITNAFAAELTSCHIRVNTIAPGPFDTKMMNSHWFNLTPDEAKKQRAALEKCLPLGRIGNPDEIAGAAIYLASDASSYTTGAEIVIDGGILLSNVQPVQD
ncbi:MAG: glucose 1-dehydrogenase [Dehalococcoidia bacterium]|jgi:NAD(P)-dependent dehydrogenase (short-subunit alcohol dehydrogenase family)